MENYTGGILTAAEIIKQVELGNIHIDNFTTEKLGPNSYNIEIGDVVKTVVPNRWLTYEEYRELCPFRTDQHLDSGVRAIDPRKPIETISHVIGSNGILLLPGQHYLIPTTEKITTDKYVPKLAGRSTSGRMSVSTFQSANFGDIGFSGVWTLQVSVMMPVIIYPHSALVQIYFLTPCGEIGFTYNGKYQNSDDAIGPKYDQSIAK